MSYCIWLHSLAVLGLQNERPAVVLMYYLNQYSAEMYSQTVTATGGCALRVGCCEPQIEMLDHTSSLRLNTQCCSWLNANFLITWLQNSMTSPTGFWRARTFLAAGLQTGWQARAKLNPLFNSRSLKKQTLCSPWLQVFIPPGAASSAHGCLLQSNFLLVNRAAC